MKEYKVKDLLIIRNGRDHKQLGEGSYPVYGSGGILRYVDSYLYNKPSILLPRKGTLDNIQYCDKPFWCVDTTYYSEINTSLANPYYLYCYLSILNLKGLDSGTALPSMTFDSYYQIKVFLPSIEIQNKIGEILFNIDQKISLNTRMNAELEAMAKQLYDYWFVQFDFPDENGKPYKSSGGKMVYNEALRREIPEGWEVKSIGDLCELNGRSLSSKDNFSIIKYLDTSNLIENNIVGFHYLKKNVAPSRAQRMVKDKTILYSTVRPLMRHYGIMNNPSKNVIASTGFVTLDTHYKNDAYRIYEFLSCDSTVMYLAKIAETAVSSYPSVNPDDIASLLLVAPDTNIIDMYYHSVDAIFQYSTEKQTEIKFLSNLRDSLLPMLMNGQVDINCE